MAKRPTRKLSRDKVRPSDVETEVVDFLGSSGIHTTREITQAIQRSPGRVYGACKRLQKREIIRVSRVPKTLYRFLLTGEVLNGANYAVVTRLTSQVARAAQQPGSLRRQMAQIFARLRSDSKLRAQHNQQRLKRYQGLTKAIRSDKQLVERISLQPFTMAIARWWPRTIEEEYEEPLGRSLKQLDRRRVRALAKRLANNRVSCSEQLARNPSVEPDQVVRSVYGMLDLHKELADRLGEAGIEELLIERDEQLGKLAALETIPQKDLEVLPKESIAEYLEHARKEPLDKRDLGGDIVLRIPRDLVDDYLRRSAATNPTAAWPKWKRWLDYSMKITAGGILVVQDLGIAFTFLAGGVVTGQVITIAALKVGTALGVMTSVYSGSKGALDTIKKLRDEFPQ